MVELKTIVALVSDPALVAIFVYLAVTLHYMKKELKDMHTDNKTEHLSLWEAIDKLREK